MRRFLLIGLLAGLGLPTLAAGLLPPAPKPVGPTEARNTVRRHLIYFRDKTGTPFSVSRPEEFLSGRALQRRQRQQIAVLPRDLPVSPAYVQQVKAVPGVQLWYTSRWFNAAVVACDSATLALVQALPFVQQARTLNRGPIGGSTQPKLTPTAPAPDQTAGTRSQYGKAYAQARQVGAVQMHDAGFRGEGMQIAVFDGGFPGVNTASVFTSLNQENRLLSTFNVVDKSANVFQSIGHGTNCLSIIAGNEPGRYLGIAPRATFRLFITEDAPTEHPLEEVNWLVAAEYADSAGVDIINSSLGYNTFDAPSADYTYADMNGRTALSTRAATVAARVGMLVVCSAGNEGNKAWRYITAPADADSIMTVGAADSLGVLGGFSSHGPTADGRIKPNLSAMGVATAVVNPDGSISRGNGTSFAGPVLAGVAAGFWQANPRLTAQQVIQLLQRSGSQATAPDNDLGYGIPDFVRAYNLANPGTPLAAAAPARGLAGLYAYPNPVGPHEPLYLQLPGQRGAARLEISVYDARGALVARQQVAPGATGAVRLETAGLRPGLFTCLVGQGPERQMVRFVVSQ
ncbi:S8 family peptidase [Hymenobacter actinosclerus]|uniref:Serine protease, subtilisin family n=1 Tax=Hymenobacter actinosclerus TaxID=82805 RepID=A0A1I0E2V6_9BACT|nr:S8 family serine peptidase [Hymenobacter actinosclerus]SET39306.1 Serine protease, subtilisin family [Hymenobacter actinosclerus]